MVLTFVNSAAAALAWNLLVEKIRTVVVSLPSFFKKVEKKRSKKFFFSFFLYNDFKPFPIAAAVRRIFYNTYIHKLLFRLGQRLPVSTNDFPKVGSRYMPSVEDQCRLLVGDAINLIYNRHRYAWQSFSKDIHNTVEQC